MLVSPVEPHKKSGRMEVEGGRARRLTDRMRQEYFSVRVSKMHCPALPYPVQSSIINQLTLQDTKNSHLRTKFTLKLLEV